MRDEDAQACGERAIGRARGAVLDELQRFFERLVRRFGEDALRDGDRDQQRAHLLGVALCRRGDLFFELLVEFVLDRFAHRLELLEQQDADHGGCRAGAAPGRRVAPP